MVMKYASDISQLICNTPLVKLNKINHTSCTVLLKMESLNPGGSIKDRLAVAMIEDAENRNLIKKDTVIIEPTSGNTGIGLALICAVKGYRLIITMPENMTIERRRLLKAYGAELVLTPAREGMKGAIKKAMSLVEKTPNSYMPMQFENQSNVEMHKKTTAEEIWEDTNGKIDIFIAGAGTGGTITGVGLRLKELKPDIKLITVEPENSPVLAGGEPGPHKLQGIGPGFIPAIMKPEIINEIVHVNYDQASEICRELAKQEGILCGISSGANVYAALNIAERLENNNKVLVVIICDTGERYLSSELFK